MKTLAAALIATLALVGVASAVPQKDTFTLSATLRARFEVPKPAGVPAGAAGSFTGKVVELANDRARLTWRLTFTKLSGRALQSHVHIGKLGKAGNVLVAPMISAAWTPLLAMAAAVVTDIGGVLSHASIVAREYGIPAVIGTGVASRRIADGQIVTVDGNVGRVTIDDVPPACGS